MITSEEIEQWAQMMLMSEWVRVSFVYEANTGQKPNALIAPYRSPAAVDVEHLKKRGITTVFADVDCFQAGRIG